MSTQKLRNPTLERALEKLAGDNVEAQKRVPKDIHALQWAGIARLRSEKPSLRIVKKEEASEYIDRIGRDARALAELLDNCPLNVTEAIGAGDDWYEVQELLVDIADSTNRAISRVRTRKHGRPRRPSYIKLVLDTSAKIFERYTGQQPARRNLTETTSSRPKAYGPFLKFVEAVYAALEINASPDSSIKDWLKSSTYGKNRPPHSA